jgi:CheY-like chemotaxis protein
LVNDYVLTTAPGGPCHALSQYQPPANGDVYSQLHEQKDTEDSHYKSKMVNDDHENKECVDQKRPELSQYQLEQPRFLIAESEKELQSLFEAYIELIGAKSVIVDSCDKVISTFFQSRSREKNYSAVILDTHLEGKSYLEVAKKIHEYDYSQRIILITTSLKDQLPKDKL